MLIFKEIENDIRKVNAEMRKMKDFDVKAYNKAARKLEALMEILDFIKSGKWATARKSCDRLLYAMKNGISNAAKYYETTEDSISVSLSQYSKTIRKLIGADTLDLIMNGNVEEGITQFRCCSGTVTLEKLLIDNPIVNIPKHCANSSDYTLADCMTELKFINQYLDVTFRRGLEQCDLQKLAYLRGLLNNNTVSIYERTALVNFLTGQMDIDDLQGYLDKRLSYSLINTEDIK